MICVVLKNKLLYNKLYIKVKLTTLLLLFLFALITRVAFADLCRNHNGNVSINGTPEPSLHNCPVFDPVHAETQVEVHNGESQSSNNSNSETIVEVHNNNNSKPNTIIKTEVITVVVTATQMPTPTVRTYIPYKAVKGAYFTPTPTLEPTTTPSATKVPVPTKALSLKPARQNLNLFQRVIQFFQNILHF